MGFRVTFSKRALKELSQISDFVGEGNPDAAQNLCSTLIDKAVSLARFPYRHPAHSQKPGVRKFTFGSYLIYYRINELKQRIVILHFWHGARQPPAF